MSKLSFKPIKKNYRLCSLKQFVGNGKLQINENTIQFSSKSVEVLVEKENGEKYRLFCDTFVSNGIKTEYINEEFLLYEELIFELNVPTYKTNCCVYYLNEADLNYGMSLFESVAIPFHKTEINNEIYICKFYNILIYIQKRT